MKPIRQRAFVVALGIGASLAVHPQLQAQSNAQATTSGRWIAQASQTSASFRGLSVVNKDVVWVSGTGGTYLWTDNSGQTWHLGAVPGAGALDFRDIYAVSLDTVYLMAAGKDTARIYKTTDRGQHWTLQYDDTRPGVFLDAIAFWDATHGIAIGDPMDGHFFVLTTDDGGAHWTPAAPGVLPPTLPSEAGFAASGTALVTNGANDAWFATGGSATARVFMTHDRGKTWSVVETPVTAGASSKGIFSLAFVDAMHGVAVGGDYSNPDSTATTAAYTDDGGKTWQAAAPSSATGYLSCVVYIPGSQGRSLIAVGTHGTATSSDGGRTWTKRDRSLLNSVMVAPSGHFAWAVGEHGTIGFQSEVWH